jgi:D-beta-D-heptose 7-phosphate kinase/D-beta-D-heptose 1-phosphate adenosyltransferase
MSGGRRGAGNDRQESALADWVKACRGRKVAVIGDVMLDRYVHGTVARISPEAPVPVVQYEGDSLFPGGAANVAANVAALGGTALLVGLVGRDAAGTDLCCALESTGIRPDRLVRARDCRTTEKVRVTANRQQLVRIDHEGGAGADGPVRTRLARAAERAVEHADAVVVEDYGKGVIMPALLRGICRTARRRGVPVVFDPKEDHRVKLPTVTVATPNRHEAFRLAGVSACPPKDPVLRDQPLRRAARVLLDEWKCENLLVTLGERGMCLFGRGSRPRHIPAASREVYDVSGAGDTVAAVVALGLAAGAPLVEACALANHAAGVVVGKRGTATASPREMMETLAP